MSESAAASDGASIVNAMSVDVEDYFHVSVFEATVPTTRWSDLQSRVVHNTERLLDLFDEFHVRATFFVLGWVAEREPALVRNIVARGHELASHGYGHRLIYRQTPAEFRADIRRARQVLEDAAGVHIAGYRAPSFSVMKQSMWALDVLIDEGHSYDASIFPIRHDRYGIPGSPRHLYRIDRAAGAIAEVPASTVRLGPWTLPIAGGGYFRILPYGWTRWGMARVNNAEQRPTVFYIHPWEIDPAQPRLPANALGRFRHYRNLTKTEQRLRALLTDFRFGTVASLLRGQLPVTAASQLAPATLPH